ncbi:MAG: tyrosine--tRNA ligase [Pelagibacterales bacterium]|nr:tyrosine--tRNA ligase [Pelagibacterales bacterium]
MTLIEELKQRGFIHQCTNEKALSDMLNSESIKFYIGFDCTAKSLHVGSLIQIMIMRLFQKYGHHPIVLIGKGTTKIGDPSGKDETRKILSSKDIDINASNLEKVFNKFLNFQSNNKAILSDNSLWLNKLNYINFLRDYGKHFTINKMLSFDSVKIRLEREQSLSFVEFNYMIFQAYDFFELNERNECILQIGGSDQWGNIVNGIELIRRSIGKESFGLTTPLLTNANGDKMGKTADGAIWLNEEFFSSYDYWQFWRNIDDRDVFRFLKLFTDLPLDEIKKIESDSKDDINLAKIILANHATTLLHGKDAASKAKKTAQDTFSGNIISENLPKISLLEKEFKQPVYIYDLIVKIGFSNSKSEARKLIRGHGVKLNQSVVKDELDELLLEDVSDNKAMISVGKKKHFIVEVNQ